MKQVYVLGLILTLVGCTTIQAPTLPTNASSPEPTKLPDRTSAVNELKVSLQEIQEILAGIRTVSVLSPSAQAAYRLTSLDSLGLTLPPKNWTGPADLGDGRFRYTKNTRSGGEEFDSTLIVGQDTGQVERTDVLVSSTTFLTGTYVTTGYSAYYKPSGSSPQPTNLLINFTSSDGKRSHALRAFRSQDNTVNTLTGELPSGREVDLKVTYEELTSGKATTLAGSVTLSSGATASIRQRSLVTYGPASSPPVSDEGLYHDRRNLVIGIPGDLSLVTSFPHDYRTKGNNLVWGEVSVTGSVQYGAGITMASIDSGIVPDFPYLNSPVANLLMDGKTVGKWDMRYLLALDFAVSAVSAPYSAVYF